MGHIQPLSLRAGGIQSVASNILQSTGRDVLRHFEEETRQGKGFSSALEEFVVRGVADHSGLAVLSDAHLRQRQGRSGDVL